MPNLYVQEQWVNATDGHRLGDGDVQESRFDNMGDIYRFGLSEYGRCIGKVYVGEGTHKGWCFQKRAEYQDCSKTYHKTLVCVLSSSCLSISVQLDQVPKTYVL